MIRFNNQLPEHKNFGNFHARHLPHRPPTPAASSFKKPSAKGPSNNLVCSKAATLIRKKEQEKVAQDSVQKELDNTIYELPDIPTLELRDGLLDALGVEPNDVLDCQFVTKKQEEDAALEKIMEEYNFDAIKDAFDDGDPPPQVKFFIVETTRTFSRQLNFSLLVLITKNL